MALCLGHVPFRCLPFTWMLGSTVLLTIGSFNKSHGRTVFFPHVLDVNRLAETFFKDKLTNPGEEEARSFRRKWPLPGFVLLLGP